MKAFSCSDHLTPQLKRLVAFGAMFGRGNQMSSCIEVIVDCGVNGWGSLNRPRLMIEPTGVLIKTKKRALENLRHKRKK